MQTYSNLFPNAEQIPVGYVVSGVVTKGKCTTLTGILLGSPLGVLFVNVKSIHSEFEF